MKRLTLLRHAKSSWSDPSLKDFDRPLNDRGERDAPRMGQRLRVAGARPSLILSSPAARAWATAKIVARSINYPLEFLQRENALYLATPDEILDTVTAQDDQFCDVMVVAHNPGLTELLARLCDSGVDNMPTAAVATVELPIKSWLDVHGARGRLVYYDYPKNAEDPVPGALSLAGR
jgi:phosphohistidine phosphatase